MCVYLQVSWSTFGLLKLLSSTGVVGAAAVGGSGGSTNTTATTILLPLSPCKDIISSLPSKKAGRSARTYLTFARQFPRSWCFGRQFYTSATTITILILIKLTSSERDLEKSDHSSCQSFEAIASRLYVPHLKLICLSHRSVRFSFCLSLSHCVMVC